MSHDKALLNVHFNFRILVPKMGENPLDFWVTLAFEFIKTFVVTFKRFQTTLEVNIENYSCNVGKSRRITRYDRARP